MARSPAEKVYASVLAEEKLKARGMGPCGHLMELRGPEGERACVACELEVLSYLPWVVGVIMILCGMYSALEVIGTVLYIENFPGNCWFGSRCSPTLLLRPGATLLFFWVAAVACFGMSCFFRSRHSHETVCRWLGRSIPARRNSRSPASGPSPGSSAR